MKIKVLFENKNLLVLDKPAGYVVHGDGSAKKQKSIADYILKNYKKIKGVGENVFIESEGKAGKKTIEIQKPGIVHRLDRDTTGCLIIAKTQDSFINLKNQFQTRKIKKEYTALVWGHIKNDTGIINAPIARSRQDFRKKEVVSIRRGEKSTELLFRGEERDALTRYKVLERLAVFGEKVTLVSFYPDTGRMHQIRIHSKSIGHPIVGDDLYGIKNTKTEKFSTKLFGKTTPHQLLHARAITLFNPNSGETIKVEAPLPKEFKKAIK